ncbi:MAG: glycoside hydrolase family 98 domain-containing protein, partial [Prevotellaceae bacterium]|nr:glycoside hydrolase family 98 domain-containing protein [Prevotellaceae bacterium]MDY5210431.1 glycoside hydrolase family 98 domain-containing protein [Prevotella sp.]
MKKHLLTILLLLVGIVATAQERRPIDSRHPLWLVHIDVWNKADPQKIIDLMPEEIRPYVCMNISMSCQYDKEKMV